MTALLSHADNAPTSTTIRRGGKGEVSSGSNALAVGIPWRSRQTPDSRIVRQVGSALSMCSPALSVSPLCAAGGRASGFHPEAIVVNGVNHDYSAPGPFAATEYEYISRAMPRQYAPP